MEYSMLYTKSRKTFKVKLNLNVTSPTNLTIYCLCIGIRRHLGQQHDLQSITLTSILYKNIYWKVIYVYFYENNFQDKSIDIICIFPNSTT
jgi:hypothetical protein